MPARPWLSVLLPVFNVEAYLRACVESLLAQLDDQAELLLYDDASTDGSAALLRQLEQEHPGRLRLLFGEQNGGVSLARNRLLDAAQGDWIWFIDADDFLEPGAVASLHEALRQPDVDLVMCDFRDVRAKPRLRHRLRGEHHKRTHTMPARQPCRDASQILAGMFLQAHLHLWTKVARRELWEGLRFPVGHCFEDIAVLPALLLRARCAYYVPEVWIGYRKRPGSILASNSLAKTDDMQRALNGLPALLDAQQPPLHRHARLAAAHFVAKTFVIASHYAARHQDRARLARYLAQFEQNAPVPAHELLRFYVARCWWWRALRLRHWLRQARLAAGTLSHA